MTRSILGISAFYHDSAACLVQDGRIVAAAQEERFTRRKGDAAFPAEAVRFCLSKGGVRAEDLEAVAFYDKPLLKFERIMETYQAVAPRGLRSFLKAAPLWMTERLHLEKRLRDALDFEGPLLFAEHHESHAASAFYPSPYRNAAILTMDGVGEWATTSIGIGQDADISLVRELHWPDSLGLLYSAFTYFTGFKVNSGEYNLMGLAPYGRPKYVDAILTHLIDLRDDGSFRMNQEYFNYLSGLTMTSPRLDALLDGPPRAPESPLTQREMDIARSLQDVTEEVMLRMARAAHRITGAKNLCLAGGVALNCVGNGRVLREGPFDSIWIQPAAGDAGGALGVALLAWHRHFGEPRPAVSGHDGMQGSYLGPDYTAEEIRGYLDKVGAAYEEPPSDAFFDRVATVLADEQVVGWFRGRMEFGPRALGARSILGDARSPRMQAQLNLKIKFRESFRPFAPSILSDRTAEYFELDVASPYMLLVAPVRGERRRPMPDASQGLWGIDLLNVPRSDVPAITHVDYSARIQTVHRETNPEYHALLSAFDRLTGCPLIVNTSFNVRGEPIVCSPADAYRCFMRTNMDYLVLGPYLLRKSDQPEWREEGDWKTEIPLD
jgi:carbamoyltransferase